MVADLNARLHARAADNPAPGLQRAAAYRHAKQPYLNYHIALALGWPIATGVIEGRWVQALRRARRSTMVRLRD